MITSPDGLSLLTLVLLGLWFLAGWWLMGRWPVVGRWPVEGWRLTLSAACALLIAGLGLTITGVVGLAWTPTLVWALALLGAAPALLSIPLTASPGSTKPAWQLPRSSWSAAVGFGAIALFAAASAWRLNMHADYVYHWGQKAAKNFLAGGLDVAFLAQPWNAYVHPDYPNLLPTLHAAAFAASGGIGWPVTATLATAFFALLVVALRALADSSPDASQLGRLAAFSVAALGSMAFAIGFRQAGGADVAMAAAMTAAAAALVRSSDRRLDLQVAVIAGLLAAVKLEGMPAAALLIGLYALRCGLDQPDRRFRRTVEAGLRSSWAFLAVVGVWAFQVFRHDLLLDSNTGDFAFAKLPEVFVGLARNALLPDWWALPLVLLALPLLVIFDRAQRFASLLLIAQLGFYVYSYAAGPVDTLHWINTSAPRLFFHLVPAALVLTLLALDRWTLRSGGSLSRVSTELA